ncbi:protoporphyrinogen oxidase [Nocardioides sp.]|uniref:protoporphyrinogen oxidase n=1 Tax=Nocardioides sp. TaxID=35761 RepID=UPI00286E1F73|nr:protoporphyrinogen oxidase [Nocardioides sp.]
MTSRAPHVVVMGAGITGLTTAYRLRQHRPEIRITVVEGSARPGGKIITDHVDGFVIEGGPDSIVTFKPQALDLALELGLAGRLRSNDVSTSGTYVMHRGRPRRLPDGMNGFIPRRIWPIAKTRLLTPAAKFRLLLEYAVPARRDPSDESVESFVSRRLGAQAYRRLVEPLVSGIFAADPAHLSLQATMPQLRAAEEKHGSLVRSVLEERRAARRARRSPTKTPSAMMAMVAPMAGMGELVEALGRNLPGVDMLLNTRVVAIDHAHNGGYSVEIATARGREWLPADAVVIAVPATAAADALQGLDHGLAGVLRETPYSSSATVSLGYRAADVPKRLEGHGYLVPAQERRMARACTWSSSKYAGRAPDGHVLLRVSLGGAGRATLAGMPDSQLMSMAQGELAASLGITAEPVVGRVYPWTGVMPQYTVGHLSRVAAAERILSAHPGIVLAGSGYHGLSIPDCIGSAERAAAAVLASVDA